MVDVDFNEFARREYERHVRDGIDPELARRAAVSSAEDVEGRFGFPVRLTVPDQQPGVDSTR
jgi:hypothetical protein